MTSLGRFGQLTLFLLVTSALGGGAGCSTGSGDDSDDAAAAGTSNAGTSNAGSAGTDPGSGGSGNSGGTAGGGTAGGGGNAGDPPELGTQIDADDPGITYSGRGDFSDAARPRFSAPGAYVKARFEGTAVSVKFEDQFRYGKWNYFYVIVDPGTPEERVVKIMPEAGKTEYAAHWGLEPGEHTVVFVKRTESSIGYVDFLGFGFDGPVLEAPEKPARKIEIIGDSISCGVGDDVTPVEERPPGVTFDMLCTEQVWGVPYHNAYKTFGAYSARALEADYQIAAVSGIGLIRTYSSKEADDTRPLPEVYDSVFLEDEASPEWDPKDFVPDVVLIALGTNDFSPGDDPAQHPRMEVDTFVDAYIEFLDKLMSDDYYPDAEFFALGSPILGDNFPDESYTYRQDLETAIAAVEAHYAGEGKDNVHALPIHKVIGRGCTKHPSAAEQLEIAEEDVIPAVREVMGW
ncbi:MAG TPA: SGNH/GDSL hydrolase family protein [Polyangiaceae bacterium]